MKIFKKSKEQVEENKSEDLKIENQENKRETTSEKKGGCFFAVFRRNVREKNTFDNDSCRSINSVIFNNFNDAYNSKQSSVS